MVLAEHEGGSIKASSLSAVEATKSLGEDNSVSILLAGSGPSLREAAQAASCHPYVSQVLQLWIRMFHELPPFAIIYGSFHLLYLYHILFVE